MMGRGAEGGCGTEEKHCPVSRTYPPSSFSSATDNAKVAISRAGGVDFFAQARKVLSERSPFDSEDAASRVTTLPVSLAVAFARHADGRRKHKKVANVEQSKKAKVVAPPPSPVVRNVWTETEEYFRDVSLGDIDWLLPTLPSPKDTCLLIPVSRGALGEVGSVGLSGKVEYEKLSTNSKVTAEEAFEREKRESELATADDDRYALDAVAAVLGKEIRTSNGEEEVEEGDDPNHDMMDIDEEDAFHGKIEVDMDIMQDKEEASENASSLNWVLASKHRAILTSERPNKKRKLLGSEAGLERILKLPLSGHNESSACDYCCSTSVFNSNKMLHCHSCKVSVHQKCYGISDAPGNDWLCSWCKPLVAAGKYFNEGGTCLLCPKKGGALKLVEKSCKTKEDLVYAHLFCSLWTPEIYVDNVKSMEPILNVERIEEARKKLVCQVCKSKHGPCVRCSYGSCRASFHPICARDSNHRMEIWAKAGCNNVELRMFCSRHSTLQDTTSAERMGNFAVSIDTGSLEGNCLKIKSPANQNTELRRSTRSKTLFEPSMHEISDVNCSIENPLDRDSLAVQFVSNGADAKLNENMQMIGLEDDNAFVDDSSVYSRSVYVIKKLIEKGKLQIDNVALDIDVSVDSLKTAVMGESTVLCPNIGLKLARWLKNSVYMDSSIVLPKSMNSCDTSKVKGNTVLDAHPEEPCGFNAVPISTLECCDSVAEVSPLTHGETRRGERKLNDNEMTWPLGSSFTQQQESGNSIGNIADYFVAPCEELGSMETNCATESCSKPKEDTEKVFKDGLAGSFLKALSEHQGADPNNQGTVDMVNEMQSDFHVLTSGTRNSKVMEWSDFYINPLIEKQLTQMDSSVAQEKSKSDVSAEASESNLDIFRKAKSMTILELSPEDEMEGEILHFQNKLLDSVAAVKHHHETLMSKVAASLPTELDAIKQKRWDSLLVYQFLREVKEAKKRGRKERRHREAQAILAAATASSCRVPLHGQDANNQAAYITEKDNLKAETTSSPQSLLHQQAKDKPSKLSISKQSHGKNSDVSTLSCDICKRNETLLNPVFVCGGCKVVVHLDCYRRCNTSISSWFCELCEEQRSLSKNPRSNVMPQCGLCGTTNGAFRKTSNGQWVHAFCAEWLSDSTFYRGQEHTIEGMDNILGTKNISDCCICHQKIGVCIKCAYGHCQTAFHPICAQSAGFYLNVKYIDDHLQHKAYCQKHSQEQRDKDDKPGFEELRSIRQIRVELEKLRLLCERIIKREKLKRELVFCSHGILSSRREYAAFSMLVRGRGFQTGVSSESATTSINNTSYSETVERSDDVTVDSTVSGKRKNINLSRVSGDRKTSERSRAHLPLSQRLMDKTFSGKQLPQRRASVLSDTTDEEKRLKPKKRTENFQKEVLMTSDQASKKNQRLPKGFVYIPVDSLQKPQDLQSREPHPPDG